MNRRDWLKAALLACAAPAALAAPPHVMYPVDPRHRLAVATYPFRAVLDAPANQDRVAAKPGMTLAGFARYVRETFKVYGIEPLDRHFPAMDVRSVAMLRKSFDAAGVRTVNIPVDAPTDLCSPDAAVRREGIATYRRWTDIAVQLGSPSIRIGSLPRCGDLADVGAAAVALRPVIDYGRSRGVIVLLENDDPALGSATRVAGILRMAGSPWLRGLPDFANGLLGGGEQFNAEAVRQMFAFAATVAHVKDGEAVRGVDLHVSLPPLFSLARKAGFRGFYSMESDDGSDPESSTGHLIERTLALM